MLSLYLPVTGPELATTPTREIRNKKQISNKGVSRIMKYSNEVVSIAPESRIRYMTVDVMGRCLVAISAYLRRTPWKMEFENLT